MKVKVSEASGLVLDSMVAKCEHQGRDAEWLATFISAGVDRGFLKYSPSNNWAQGGPIIEREKFELSPRNGAWICFGFTDPMPSCCGEGATPLIAAMRCYVASKLGNEVEVPLELL